MKTIIVMFVLLVVLVFGAGINVYLKSKEEGARAYRQGIPAKANPYIGNYPYAVRWLEGYIAEKQRSEE